MRRALAIAVTVLALAMLAAIAQAGMPEVDDYRPYVTVLRLGESSERILEAISFFLAVLLLVPLVVRWLWNSLRRDFPALPRISYGKSLGLVVLWGLLFLVVLTMITATREMMTPGTWQKKGLLYHIPEPSAAPPAEHDRWEARP
jgi:hypothetical protein